MIVSAATQPVLLQVAQETQAKELVKQVQEMQERLLADPEAAKAAIEGFTASAAATYAPRGIRFNVLAPGLTDTPMSRRAMGDPRILEFIRTKQPLDGGRPGQPTDLDGAVVFFLLRQSLGDLGTLYLLLLGSVAIVVMLWAPKGIWGLIVDRFGWQLFPLERRVVLDDRGAARTTAP